jgi:hypothetical protein
VRGPTAQYAPEALNDIELRAITRQPFHPQMRMCGSHLLHQGPSMPGRMINRDDDCGILTGRIGVGDIPEVRCKRYVQALLFALPSLRFAARWLLEQVGRQASRHDIERGKTIDLVLVIPRADGGAMALDPQRGPSRRHQGKAGLVLTQQHARPGLGFFFTPPVLPGPPVAPRGRLAKSERSAGTAAWHGADKSPAWPCASR